MPMKDWFARTEITDAAPTEELALESNPEPRAQCVLVLDTSGSMARIIERLNEAIVNFDSQLKADPLGRERVEIAVITFGPVKVAQDFVVSKDFAPPRFAAGGDSPMGEGICKAVELIEERRQKYKHFGIDSFKPCVFGITDGAVVDGSFDRAQSLIRKFETTEAEADRIAFFFAGVEGADMDALTRLSYRKPQTLDPRKFQEMFRWMGLLMRSISRSQVGEEVEVPTVDWMKL
jgi:uncharacterized protein YegL